MSNIRIKDYREEDRPREKMLERGATALTDAELLAILLRTGSNEASALDLARTLLDSSGGSVSGVSNLSLDGFTTIKGIGKTKALTLLAAFEAGRRSMSGGRDTERVITDARDAVEMIAPLVSSLDHEECWVIFLNRVNRVITKERMSSGGSTSTTFDVKMVVKRAVERLACGVIMVHNHPGGNPAPGEKDRRQTEALRKALSLLDISLLDHIIVARNKYYSFSEEDFKRHQAG